MADQIKPRIDEHGVGWCDAGCPMATRVHAHDCICDIDSADRWFGGKVQDVCPHHARIVTAKRDRLRELVKLYQDGNQYDALQLERDMLQVAADNYQNDRNHWILDLLATYPPEADEEVTP